MEEFRKKITSYLQDFVIPKSAHIRKHVDCILNIAQTVKQEGREEVVRAVNSQLFANDSKDERVKWWQAQCKAWGIKQEVKDDLG